MQAYRGVIDRGRYPVVALLDPLLAGPQLEAVYCKSQKPRAVLYQVLADNRIWPLPAITVSASLDAKHGPPAVLDNDTQTGWLTPANAAPDTPASLTADLGKSEQINRIWLLLPADATLWLEAYRLEASAEGVDWTQVALVEHDPLNERQNPRVFSFAPMPAHYVRFTALRLRAGPAGQYQAGLNALRVSLSGAGQPAAP